MTINEKQLKIRVGVEDQFYTDMYHKILLTITRIKTQYNGTCFLSYDNINEEQLFYLIQHHIFDNNKKRKEKKGKLKEKTIKQ